MSNKGKFAKSGSSGKSNSKLIIALSCVAAFLVILLVVLLLLIPREEIPKETTVPTESTVMPTETENTTVPSTTIPAETDPLMLDSMVEYYEKNPDIVGWLKIEGIELDDPVMYVEGDNHKYLYKNFDLDFHPSGVPFIDGSCTLDPESDNLIIYGHNMLDGDMFGNLKNFADEKFWREHPTFTFSTLYEEREYEIVAAFYDRIYDENEDTFKFYEFIHAIDEENFNKAIAYFKDHAKYDTGVTPEYGDHLITLVTCSYHAHNGRFVVVARQIVEEPNTDANTAE